MNRPLHLMIAMTFLAGCIQGQWVKEGATFEETKRAYAECQTMSSLQPRPATLSDKISANPDLSGLALERCMLGKGYQWATEESNQRPPADPTTSSYD